MEETASEIRVIELRMMDQSKYMPLTISSGLVVRGLLYPLTLIRTRQQIQTGRNLYTGTFHSFREICKAEGFFGLYRGFWVNSLQIVSSFLYINTYERVRHYLQLHTSIQDSSLRGLIAGSMAAVVGQTFTVPIEVVSQHMMMVGHGKQSESTKQKLRSLQRIHVPDNVKETRFGPFLSIVRQLQKRDGVRGFYRGYFVSVGTYAPSSGLWWFFYDSFSAQGKKFTDLMLPGTPLLLVQGICAPFAGVCSSVLTNPIDVIRAQVQVKGGTVLETLKRLKHEEGARFVTKGLVPRCYQSMFFSFFIIVVYESIKRFSLLPEYKYNT